MVTQASVLFRRFVLFWLTDGVCLLGPVGKALVLKDWLRAVGVGGALRRNAMCVKGRAQAEIPALVSA